jgi:predicted sugar kinase
VGRGQRSAVGTYGFRDGGLIVEDGKTTQESLGVLRERVALPRSWRVVLVRLAGISGLAGDEEVSAFATLPPLPDDLTATLRCELHDRLLPAARKGDFATFAESVYRYGYAAGECFAANQGGPFLTASIAEFVSFCRQTGVHGVGQSSWGPTVFCWFPNAQSADNFVNRQLVNHANFSARTTVTPVAQHGATLAVDVA